MSTGTRPTRPDRSLWAVPEVTVAFLSFVLHYVWEFLQVPTYAGMADLNHWEGIKICTSATVGDVGFALTAFWITALAARSRHWISGPKRWQLGLFVAVGIALTVGFEYYYTEVSLRWTYSDFMPRVPPFGTGLSPLVQWIVVPLLVVSLGRRVLGPR
ncbi:hypothetical protein DEM25_008020 [Oceaniradius stylonematis]|uniref:Uncharacterized protein n=1 Tax=Oceaniradius stylonematis TaxID=2184161 RepID=A0A3A8AP53_9HYPH|nr:hypothetical protein [Oceaniradius stylonematis]RKF07693.1 hypothetical protein DEM25_008020 [Oceaniradius stylonematis]